MTQDEARKILDDCAEFINFDLDTPRCRVSLDGYFGIEEVEAVLVLMRADQPGDERGG